MKREFEADGDRWLAGLESRDPHPGVRALVFHCISNPQRPYRVREVPAAVLPSREALEQLSENEMQGLFEGSEPMDYTHDPRAAPEHVGLPPQPPGGRTDPAAT